MEGTCCAEADWESVPKEGYTGALKRHNFMLHYHQLLSAWQKSLYHQKWSGQSGSPQIRVIFSGWWSVISRNRWKWENGSRGSHISNKLAAAVGRQEKSVDVEVEGHTRLVKPITSNYDQTTFIVWSTKMLVYSNSESLFIVDWQHITKKMSDCGGEVWLTCTKLRSCDWQTGT